MYVKHPKPINPIYTGKSDWSDPKKSIAKKDKKVIKIRIDVIIPFCSGKRSSRGLKMKDPMMIAIG